MFTCVLVWAVAISVTLVPTISAELTICLDGKHFNNATEVKHIRDSEVNCIYQLDNVLANITVVTGNTAAIASQIGKNVSVMGEFTDNLAEVVILLNNKNDVNNKELKYCHPGASNTKIPPWMVDEYRRSRLKDSANFSTCRNKSLTIVENEFDAWNRIFGSSCIPGPWTSDGELDKELKNRYPKLTELCQFYQEGMDGFQQSLDCLVTKGDLAVTTLTMAKSFIENNPKTKLHYLCKNGTLADKNSPCVWSTLPGKVLLANKEISEDLSATLRYEFPEVYSRNLINVTGERRINLTPDEKNFFETILKNETVRETSTTDLKKYMEDIQGVPSKDTNICQRRFKWCTISPKEYEKCCWMQLFARNYGVNYFDCKLLQSITSDRYECIQDIVEEKSDVAFIENREMYVAMKQGLKLILISKESVEEMTRTLLVVNPSKIRSLTDFEKKNACFSQAFDAGFVSFVDAFKKYILTKETCLYDEGLSSFVERACIPGIMDKMLKASGGVDFARVCKQCEATPHSETAVNCNADSTVNLYAENEGALMCLDNKRGDYAVLTLDHRLNENLTLPEGTKVMCRNGSLSDTLDVDEDCFLAVLPSGGLVVDRKNQNFKDIQLALMELAKKSGATSSFNIFGSFDGVDNLLFPNLLLGFGEPYDKNVDHEDASSKYIQKYAAMMNSTDKCDVGPRKLKTEPKSSTLSIVLLILGVIAVAIIAGVVFWRKRMASSNIKTDNNSQDDSEEEPREQQPLTEHTQNGNTQAPSGNNDLTSQVQ